MIRKTSALHLLRIDAARDGPAPPVRERVRHGIGEMDARYGKELRRPVGCVPLFENPPVLGDTHDVADAKALVSRVQQFHLVINVRELKFSANAFGSDPDRPMFPRVVLFQ